MGSIRPAKGPIPKPIKKPKKPAKPLARGGRKPREAGRRYEHAFADKYALRRVLGSGAFAAQDPTLSGDIVGEIGRLRVLFEAKSWGQLDGRGEKVVSFPVAFLEKIAKEAKLLQREPIFIYHVKGASNEWAVVEYSWLHELILRWETDIMALMQDMEG